MFNKTSVFTNDEGHRLEMYTYYLSPDLTGRPKGAIIIEYDSNDRIIYERDLDGEQHWYEYDSSGNLIYDYKKRVIH